MSLPIRVIAALLVLPLLMGAAIKCEPRERDRSTMQRDPGFGRHRNIVPTEKPQEDPPPAGGRRRSDQYRTVTFRAIWPEKHMADLEYGIVGLTTTESYWSGAWKRELTVPQGITVMLRFTLRQPVKGQKVCMIQVAGRTRWGGGHTPSQVRTDNKACSVTSLVL